MAEINCRIPCHLFACHWIRIASIVLCFVLQRTPTNENNGGTEWRGIQQLLRRSYLWRNRWNIGRQKRQKGVTDKLSKSGWWRLKPQRNFEVTSTELRWTGLNQVILIKGRNVTCHLRAGPAHDGIQKEFLISRVRSRVTGQLCMQWEHHGESINVT